MGRVTALVVLLIAALAYPANAAGFAVASPAVADGGRIPTANAGPDACLGGNVSLPLRWMNAPPDTKSFAVVVVDLDGAGGLLSVHWVAYGISAQTAELPAGFGTVASSAFVGGQNTRKMTTYYGPCSRPGDAPHHYAFTVIACDIDTRTLPPGLTRDGLFAALAGHALTSSSLVVTYSR
jgi:Raf kinase inhibitor-like YbhB/YbcL family protein